MWDAITAIAAAVAIMITFMVGRGTIRGQTLSTLDQRAPDVTVTIESFDQSLRSMLPRGGWGVAHTSWGDQRFMLPWCLTKPGSRDPSLGHPGERPDDGDLRWGCLLKVNLQNHATRTVTIQADDLIDIDMPESRITQDAVISSSNPVGRVTIGPGEVFTAWLPVVRTMREWAALHGTDTWEQAAVIWVDDGQDFGVTERRTITVLVRPVEPVDVDSLAGGPKRCSTCGERLWRVKSEAFASAAISAAVRTYYQSKTEGREVAVTGSIAHLIRRSRKR